MHLLQKPVKIMLFHIRDKCRRVKKSTLCILVFTCFESKRREVHETTAVSSSKEPLEETPQEAEGEELAQLSHLFPIGEQTFRMALKLCACINN